MNIEIINGEPDRKITGWLLAYFCNRLYKFKRSFSMIELQSYFIRISNQKICIAIVFELIYEDMEGKNWKIEIFIKWW